MDNTAYPAVFFPSVLTLDNFRAVFEQTDVFGYTVNSGIVSSGATG